MKKAESRKLRAEDGDSPPLLIIHHSSLIISSARAWDDPDRVQWLLADQQGTVRDVLDRTGQHRLHVAFDAFGGASELRWTVAAGVAGSGAVFEQVVTAAAGFDLTAQLAAVGRYWFQGRELDAWTNFYYVRARWLDPLTGTWLNPDPIFDDLRNTYRFVGNDPINHTDPTGLAELGAVEADTWGDWWRGYWYYANPFNFEADRNTHPDDRWIRGGTRAGQVLCVGGAAGAVGVSAAGVGGTAIALPSLKATGAFVVEEAIETGAEYVIQEATGTELPVFVTPKGGLKDAGVRIVRELCQEGGSKAGRETLEEAAEKLVKKGASDNVPRPGQILGRGPSSTILGENLEAAGKVRPPNSAAHHVVAGTDPRAAQARAILQREGIDINEATNGVFLPKNNKFAAPPAQTHSTVHTNHYYDEVNRELSRAAPGTVRDVLADIERRLLNGTFPN